MTAVVSNNRKYLMSGALIVVVAVSAYGLGRVYPPLGPSEGTIAPAERYVSSQVGEGDVTLGDTSVAQLMQTDAFEVMTKDPNFLALARDPNFAAFARNPQAFEALARNPQAFEALARNPQAFDAALKAAQATAAAGRNANARDAQAIVAMARNPPRA